MRITLSSMQYTMLKEIKRERVFSLSQAAQYKQPTYTSMVGRGYLVTDTDKEGNTIFTVTTKASAAMLQFEADDILRSRASSNLSAWLDNYVKRSQRRKAS